MFGGGDDRPGSTTQPALYYPAQPGSYQQQTGPSTSYPSPVQYSGLPSRPQHHASQSGTSFYPGAAYPAPGAQANPGVVHPHLNSQATASLASPPVATASNTSSVTTYAVRIRDEYRISQGVPTVSLRSTEDRQLDIDLSLEEEINRAELAAASEEHAHRNGADTNGSLLAGMDDSEAHYVPIRIPTSDALGLKLQQLSARAVGAANDDEEILRLALIKCSERDEAGIIAFCEGVQQVLDVTGGRADKYEAAMKLIAGQEPADLIQSYSF